MVKCCNQLKMPYSANLFFQCLCRFINPKEQSNQMNLSITIEYTYNRAVFLFIYIQRDTTSRGVVSVASVCGRDLTFFFGMSPYKHRQQPTQQPVTLLGAASGNGSHRPFDSCENAPGKVGATSASEVQRKSAIVRRRLVRVLRRRCQAIRNNRARAIQHDAVLSRRPDFILPSCQPRSAIINSAISHLRDSVRF